MAGRRRITEAQLKALAKGRRTAAANRRKKKAPARRRRNPMLPKNNPRGKYTTIKLAAPNSTSGNPRRLYLTFEGGGLRGIFDEEYDGDMAIPLKLRSSYAGHTYKISPAEYNRLNKIRKVWETTESAGTLLGNPAHGNFMNAIAAKERGDLGREAYQNPVRPRQKQLTAGQKGHQGQPRLLIAAISKGRVVYLNAMNKWGPKSGAAGFARSQDAVTHAKTLARKSMIVLPYHTSAEILKTFRRR